MVDPTLRQRRKEARPQELLEAALSLFVEKGFAASRSEEVAVRAGVSKGTLYLYYPSKEDLFKAVVRQTLSAEIAEGVRVLEEHQGSVSEALVQDLADWWVRVYESPGSAVFKLAITEMRNFPDLASFYAEEVVLPGCTAIANLVMRGIEAGEFRAVDVNNTVHSIVLPMIMLCLHKHSIGACTTIEQTMQEPHAFIRQHLALVLRGLQSEAALARSAAEVSGASSVSLKLPKIEG